MASNSSNTETRKSSRQRQMSERAQENEMANGIKRLNSYIAKFNKLNEKSEDRVTQEYISELQEIVLGANAEIHFLGTLSVAVDNSDVRELGNQVDIMSEHLTSITQTNAKDSRSAEKAPSMCKSQSYFSVNTGHGKHTSVTSRSSIRLAKSRINAANLDIEIDTLRKQSEIKSQIELRKAEMNAQIEQMQLELKASELEAKRQMIQARTNVLEQYGLDEREEIENALDDSRSMPGDPRSQLHASDIPQRLNTVNVSAAKSVISCYSNNSDTNSINVDVLAQSITKAMHASRLPAPEPTIFEGNPLEYVDWNISFRALIENSSIPESDRIHYLKRYVGGTAKEAISGYFLLKSSDAYIKARGILEDRFGSSYAVSESFRTKLNQWPKIKANDNLGVQAYSDFLLQCEAAMSSLKELNILNDSQQNRSMYGKLPDWLSNRWKRKVTEFRKAQGSYPPFHAFVDFVKDESDIMNDPVTMSSPLSPDKLDASTRRQTVNAGLANTRATASAPQTDSKHCGFCNMNSHELADCFKFAKLKRVEKNDYVTKNKLCYHCLQGNHLRAQCQQKMICKRCQGQHSTSMHFDSKPLVNQTSLTDANSQCTSVNLEPEDAVSNHKPQNLDSGSFTSKSSIDNSKEVESSSANCNASSTDSGLSSMIVPVWICDSNRPQHEILVYAILDSASDTTFVTKHAANDLSMLGQSTTLKLTTMNGETNSIECSRYDNMTVRGYNCKDKIVIPHAYSTDKIPLDKSHVPSAQVAKSWPHLQQIADKFPVLENCPIALLIGYDVSKALIPRQSIVGQNDTDPFAVRTSLGWSIVGNTGLKAHSSNNRFSNKIVRVKNKLSVGNEPTAVTFKCKMQKPESEIVPSDILDVLQQDFAENQTKQSCVSMSKEDMLFMSTLKDGIIQTNEGNYTMPLPFRARPKELPNNRRMAEKRLELLKAKLAKNKQLKSDYMKFMSDIIATGDAEPVPGNGCEGSKWYIPHFGVYHPKKPGKIRVVFDCSAKYADICINDYLIQGPDLMNRLAGVLHRFRIGKIGIMCDIQKMFHMFKVNKADRDFLRFLWFTDDSLSKIAEYRMTVHLFGATSSPGCATYALRHLAETNHNPTVKHSVMAKAFIVDNFYVDDGLVSLDSVDDATNVISEAVAICKKANVRLHKFTSNSKQVLDTIPNSEKAEAVKDLDLQSSNSILPIERALGLKWCTESDTFKFSAVQSRNEQKVTKRSILSTTASLFDPLGFLSPFTLLGKQILQSICKTNANWDDPVNETDTKQGLSWKSDMKMLEKISIPRCITPPDFDLLVKTELHHFSDASSTGYGQCSYLRVVDCNGRVHVSLLGSKSRVIPLRKAITIPRAELQAAVLSTKMAEALKNDYNFANITDEIFWTDSRVTLGYITNKSKRFHVYVANRVQQIVDLSRPSQWHYVSSKINPADMASRGVSVNNLIDSCWFQGPKFLWAADLSDVLTTDNYEIAIDDPEVKANCHTISTHNSSVVTQTKSMANRLEAFSTLNSAVRAISQLQNLANIKCKESTRVSAFERQQAARLQILKWAQQEAYAKEYQQVKLGKLQKGNKLANLDVFIDSKGLLRVGGRLRNSELSFEEKHPIVLPKHSHITKLVIKHCHMKVMHQGRGMTIAEIQNSGYWVVGCNALVSSLIKGCIVCRKTRRPVESQKMGDLPYTRTAIAPPFTYVGSDCFGPFYVKDYRKELKKYGVIFTCMASRAIHIELVDDMSTDAFINALRSFIAIRGPIRQIHTDKGANFIGAAKELAQKKQDNEAKFSCFANSNNIEWITNTPYSSHMGGVWERHIRTIRSILNSMLSINSTRLTSSTLRTFLYEVMAIINCRPLAIETEKDSPVPLSPNQILTMKSKVVLPPPGNFNEHDIYSRKRWRVVQGLANQFWTRWQKHYLNELQVRQKWTQKSDNICVDDVVMIAQDDQVRSQWSLAKVCEVYKSKDNLVRKVKLCVVRSKDINAKGKRVTDTYLERPIHKLVFIHRPAN